MSRACSPRCLYIQNYHIDIFIYINADLSPEIGHSDAIISFKWLQKNIDYETRPWFTIGDLHEPISSMLVQMRLKMSLTFKGSNTFKIFAISQIHFKSQTIHAEKVHITITAYFSIKGIVNCQNTRDMGSPECNSGLWIFHNNISRHIYSYQPR